MRAAVAAGHPATVDAGVEILEDFAQMTGVEMVVIDDDTTTRSFQRELRWNAAYHRLAEGI